MPKNSALRDKTDQEGGIELTEAVAVVKKHGKSGEDVNMATRRSAMQSFHKFYGTHYVGKGGKLKKKRYVAARGEWAGDPETGEKSQSLRRKAKAASRRTGRNVSISQIISAQREMRRAKRGKPKSKYY